MKIQAITSEANPLLKKIKGLRVRSHREKEGLFILEGPHALVAAIQSGLDLESVLLSDSFLQQDQDEIKRLNLPLVHAADDKLVADVLTTAGPCGVIAVAKTPVYKPESIFNHPQPFIVVLDAIQDPGNLGTIFRSAHAAECTGILLAKGCVDPFNPKVVRSAAGALFDLPHLVDLPAQEIVELLNQHSVKLLVCDAGGQSTYFESRMTGSCAVVFGNEGQGISQAFAEAAAETLSIPMNPRAESLNVAVSAGIILFEAYRQRLKQR